MFVSLGSVIEYDIKDHLDAIGIECTDHGLQLSSLAVVFQSRCIACVRREVAHCIVAPVIEKLLSVDHPFIRQFIELEYRHQLDCIDTELLQIRQLFHQSSKGAGMFDLRAFVHCKAADVHFIDDHILKRDMCIFKITPVEHILDHARMIGAVGCRADAPSALTSHSTRVRVKQKSALVEQQTTCRIVRPVHAVGIFEFRDVETEHDH